jgi:hypothetical protein
MAFVLDSTTPGFLGPEATPQPIDDDKYDDFLQALVAGVTGMDPTMVRPRWQNEPPNLPDLNSDWVAVGVTETRVDPNPWIGHSDAGEGDDLLQEHEISVVLCTFYGPNAGLYASYLRRGLYVWQNRAVLRANAVGLVETTELARVPEIIQNIWINRIDVNLILRREIRYNYPVRTLLRAQGEIIAQPPGDGTRTITDDFDTGFIPQVVQPTPQVLGSAGAMLLTGTGGVLGSGT